jgi:hypothetical protein
MDKIEAAARAANMPLYAASLGQRKRVAHIPTAEAARSGLILEGQGSPDYTLNPTTRGPTNGVQFIFFAASARNASGVSPLLLMRIVI